MLLDLRCQSLDKGFVSIASICAQLKLKAINQLSGLQIVPQYNYEPLYVCKNLLICIYSSSLIRITPQVDGIFVLIKVLFFSVTNYFAH